MYLLLNGFKLAIVWVALRSVLAAEADEDAPVSVNKARLGSFDLSQTLNVNFGH